MTRVGAGINNDDHYRYQQLYKGIPVECGRIIEHFRECLLVSINGKFLCDISMDVNPLKSPAEVISIAMNDMNSIDYLWDDPNAELELQEDTENPEATYYPQPELLIDCDKNLIYRFKLITLSETKEYSIDANTGNILTKIDPSVSCFHSEMNDMEHDCSSHNLKKSEKCPEENILVGPIQTTGSTLFSGQQLMPTNWHYNIFSGGKHQLKYDFNKNKIETRDNELSPDFNDWRRKIEYSGTSGQPFTWPATDITHTQTHWAAMNSWEYFRAIHGASIHRDEGTMRVVSNSGVFGAFYLSDNRTIIFGSIAALGGYLGTMDVVGHEFTHLAVHERSELGQIPNLASNAEQRSLNESFADIFGTLIEMEYHPNGGDWLMNSENVTLRNVMDPVLSPTIPGIISGPQPEVYEGANWVFNPNAPGPHINGGVQNKWFALLAEGGAHNGEWVEGIGIDKAAQITWHNLDNYIEVNSDYTDARNGAVQSAIDLFGECSVEHQQTVIAWEACGIGEWTPCYTQDGPSVICTGGANLPLSVTMSGNSNSPLTWTPVDLTIGPFTWGTSNWTWSTTGATNNTLVITNIPNNTNTGLLYLFRYEDAIGNSGLVLFRFVDCLVSSDPDPEEKFYYCDWIQTRSNSSSNYKKISKINIDPNPVQDQLVISGIDTEESYRIVDMTGREFSRGKIMPNQLISVSTLPNGIYIFQIINDETELKYGKFIKTN